MRFFSQKLVLIFVLVAAPAPALAFDPLGFLVNKIMDHLIEEAHKPKKPKYSLPVSRRAIPNNSIAGILEPPEVGNILEIDGDEFPLARNSRIRDEGNRIVHIGHIQQEKRIRYTLDGNNHVDRVWFLSSQEQ